MNNIAVDVGQRIRVLRIRRGLTQEELAEKADLHTTYIGQIERGEKNMTITSMDKILEALDVPFSEFFEHFDSRDSRESIASKCYTLISGKDKPQQEIIYRILRDIDLISTK